MRIVHLNTERTWRGGERQTLWLARALAARGHDSRVACRPGFPLEARARAEGLPVVPCAPLFEFDPFAALSLRRSLLGGQAELLHAHTAHAAGLGALAVLGTGARLVATRRVDFPLRDNFPTRWKYRRADRLVCISSRVREMVLAGGVPAEKAPVIPSGIDVSGYPSPADRDRLRKEKGLSRGDVVVVHVGALVPHKDQATLLKAVQRVSWEEPRLKLVMVGDGPLRSELEKLARDLGIAGLATFQGHDPDPLGWTALADLFVFSSREEGLGTALLDALAVGVPTAATAAGGIPDIYGGPGVPELSPPEDPAALARNILAALKDPAEAGRRVERGRERAKRFTVDAMTEAYEKLYESLPR